MKVLKTIASLLVFVSFAAQARTININYDDATTIVDTSDTLVCKFTVTTLGVDLSTRIPQFQTFTREADPRIPLMIEDADKKIEYVTDNAVSISVTEHRIDPKKPGEGCRPYITKSKNYVKQGRQDFLDTIDLNLTHEELKDWQTKRAR